MDVSGTTMQHAVSAYYKGQRYVPLTNTQEKRFSSPHDYDLAQLSKASYDATRTVAGPYHKIERYSDPAGRFSAWAVPGTKTITIAARGTDVRRGGDLFSDALVAQGLLRYDPRVKDLNKMINKIPEGYKIVLTGHSMGSSVIREVSNNRRVHAAVGFNTGYMVPTSYGPASGWLQGTGKFDKFSDYVNDRDPVSIGSWIDRGKHTRYNRPGYMNVHQPFY